MKNRPQIPEFDHQHRPFLEKLAAAGFPTETIDLVVCTHLHVDHVGWNTRLVDSVWTPTFPNARYLFAEQDVGYFAHSDDPLHASAFADSVAPIIDAGLADRVDSDVSVAGGSDPELAVTTRRALLEAAAATDALVLGSHFAGSAAGRIVSTNGGHRFAPQP